MKRALVFILIAAACGCGLSQGLQRKKLEYTYKFKNQASLLNEFSYEIPNYSRLELYKDRVNKMQNDMNGINTIEGWERSKFIKEEFVNLLKANRSITDSLLNVFKKEDTLKLGNNPSITKMQENAGRYLEFIDKEISAVEKE
jgi:hypothetical protein